MVDKITADDFTRADGTADWRAGADSATAQFETGSFSAGVALIDEIGRLADAANHHPDVDLRYPSVTVTLSTHEVDGLSERDVALAVAISAAASAQGVSAAPAAGSAD